MTQVIGPFRLCNADENSHKGRNPVMGCLPALLDEDFGDIAYDPDRLRSLYVPQRYEDVEDTQMNGHNPGRYGPNVVSRWSDAKNGWERVDQAPSDDPFRRFTDDAAELSLLHQITEFVELIRERSSHATPSCPSTRNVSPPDRTLHIQGGIGTGKTTMLHHFAQVVVPKINGASDIPMRILPVILDLNVISDAARIGMVWRTIEETIRRHVHALTMLDTVDGWNRIAASEIVDSLGRLVPRIATSVEPAKEKQRVINESKTARVFLRRAARALASEQRPYTLLIVLDNLDQRAALRQVAIIREFMSFLDDIPEAVGVVAVRESTLGRLANLRHFRAYVKTPSLHITTPRLGVLLQRRIDDVLHRLKDVPKSQQVSVRIGASEITTYDATNMLHHIGTAFRPDAGRPLRSHLSLMDFINCVTNSNARLALHLMSVALQSWAMSFAGLVIAYLWQRDNKMEFKLPEFSFDELLCSACVGEYEFYDHTRSNLIFNVFATNEQCPVAAAGRFPLLFTYRVMQYLKAAGGKASLRSLVSTCACLGYSERETRDVVEQLISYGFAESEEGCDIEVVRDLYATRKLNYYIDVLCVTLTYLENMRNDCVIEYDGKPHALRESPRVDIDETLKFIRYLASQEMQEYAYVKKRGDARIISYRRIATGEPISWKLLRNVDARHRDIHENHPTMFTPEEDTDLLQKTASIKAEIKEHCDQDRIWPPIAHAYEW